MANRTVWIYAMIDPRDQLVKYIGQTVNLKTRYSAICHGVISCSMKVREWVHGMKQDKVKPTMIILQETNQTDAGKVELKWIMTFLEAGAPLLNQQLYEAHDYREAANWWNKEKGRWAKWNSENIQD